MTTDLNDFNQAGNGPSSLPTIQKELLFGYEVAGETYPVLSQGASSRFLWPLRGITYDNALPPYPHRPLYNPGSPPIWISVLAACEGVQTNHFYKVLNYPIHDMGLPYYPNMASIGFVESPEMWLAALAAEQVWRHLMRGKSVFDAVDHVNRTVVNNEETGQIGPSLEFRGDPYARLAGLYNPNSHNLSSSWWR